MLEGKTVYFLGKLKASNRAEASRVVRGCGGEVVRELSSSVNIVVVGEGDILSCNWNLWNDQLDSATKAAFESGRLEIITEAFFWCKYDNEQTVENSELTQSLFTPSMLYEITKLPLSIIRQLERRQLIIPSRRIHRLNYYDAESVLTLRIVRSMLDSGVSATQAMNMLQKIKRNSSNIDLCKSADIQFNGRELFIVTKNGAADLRGQLLFQFVTDSRQSEIDLHDQRNQFNQQNQPSQNLSNQFTALVSTITDRDELERLEFQLKSGQSEFLSFLDGVFEGGASRIRNRDQEQEQSLNQHFGSWEQIQSLYDAACHAELSGDLDLAVEIYRTIIITSGSTPQLNFQIAELLYRRGELAAARERYFIALEQDEEFVEARANLGCVLAELGEDQLAIAAFRGALKYHQDYAEVHFHLGMLLSRVGVIVDAVEHLQLFIDLTPDSPWVAKANDTIQAIEKMTKSV
ncbi:MAG: tetratricopeptide repeat protein [Planctomycetaceae bacterium]|nr:tetratricopeptide repeat protein [Planctomycetaceae bacterium]